MRLLLWLALVMMILLSVACSDDPTGLNDPAPAVVAKSEMTMIPGSGMYYRCSLLRPKGRPSFQLLALDIGKYGIKEAPGRNRTTYTLTSIMPDGRVVSRLECQIPATQQAGSTMHEVLGVKSSNPQAAKSSAGVLSPYVITTADVISIEGFHVVVDGTDADECDPYLELGFTCEEETCLEAPIANPSDFTMQSNSCTVDGGGGTTGDGGGTSDGDDPNDPHFEEACPDCWELDASQLLKLDEATTHICTEGRSPVANALQAGEYGMRSHSWPIRGWHHSKFHTNESAYHYSFNQSHPGWTGTTYEGESIGPTQQLIELAGTSVHEYFHHIYPGESESQIQKRTTLCVPGYMG